MYPSSRELRPEIDVVMAVRDNLLSRGLIRDKGWSFTIYPVGTLMGIKADFSGAMTPKWKRLIRYWTSERGRRAL